MKPIWLTPDSRRRKEVIEQLPRPRYAIWNRFQAAEEMEGLFDGTYRLSDLFKDEVFFDALAKIDGSASLVFFDLGIDTCVATPSYIKEYTKLRPLSLSAARTIQFDHFVFYFTEKAIYRPFLYCNQTVFDATLQEFYGVGPYKGFDGNRVENYVEVVRPFIECEVDPIPIEVVSYQPTQAEIDLYEATKYRLIMQDRRGKQTVINGLFDLIRNFESKRAAIASYTGDGILIEDNDSRRRYDVYEQAIDDFGQKLVFFRSGVFGADEMALDATVGAIQRHNDLVRLLNAQEA